MAPSGYVSILTNDRNTVLDTGGTSDPKQRVYQHREKLVKGFSARYNLHQLVYSEAGDSIVAAIAREKQFKAGPRRRKIALMESMNPGWKDIWEEL